MDSNQPTAADYAYHHASAARREGEAIAEKVQRLESTVQKMERQIAVLLDRVQKLEMNGR